MFKYSGWRDLCEDQDRKWAKREKEGKGHQNYYKPTIFLSLLHKHLITFIEFFI